MKKTSKNNSITLRLLKLKSDIPWINEIRAFDKTFLTNLELTVVEKLFLAELVADSKSYKLAFAIPNQKTVSRHDYHFNKRTIRRARFNSSRVRFEEEPINDGEDPILEDLFICRNMKNKDKVYGLNYHRNNNAIKLFILDFCNQVSNAIDNSEWSRDLAKAESFQRKRSKILLDIIDWRIRADLAEITFKTDKLISKGTIKSFLLRE